MKQKQNNNKWRERQTVQSLISRSSIWSTIRSYKARWLLSKKKQQCRSKKFKFLKEFQARFNELLPFTKDIFTDLSLKKKIKFLSRIFESSVWIICYYLLLFLLLIFFYSFPLLLLLNCPRYKPIHQKKFMAKFSFCDNISFLSFLPLFLGN